jgi:LPS export ABC transporter protein LptC
LLIQKYFYGFNFLTFYTYLYFYETNLSNLLINRLKRLSYIYIMIKLLTQLFLIIVLSSFISCSTNQDEPSGPKPDSEQLPDQESWQSTIIITRNGSRIAEVWAGHIASYNEKNETTLNDSIHIDFYNQEGKHNSVLTADKGVVYNRTNNMVAIGNVIVVSDSGIVLETKELKWDNQQQKIISDVPVIFTTKTEKLIGDSFVSDPDLKNYEIKNARGYTQRVIPLKNKQSH